ncbi:erythromycin esterase family protein [Streptomyces sp. NPDC053429]|uniref:erythromycin esterase family protein n=1 Tax=Streptomyces sp. NPDC053429 TaxID=3365702 RepID=UPI0037D2B3B9
MEKNHPEALPRLNELYAGLRPVDDVFAYLGRPLAQRQELAARAQQAWELVSSRQGSGSEAFHWAEQNARSIAQTAKFTVGGAEPGRNEHTLDQVGYRDFHLDVRKAPAAARAWLNVARPTLNVGTQFPEQPRDVAIAKSFDVLIHLHEVREAHRPAP